MPGLLDRLRAATLRWLGVNELALLPADELHRRIADESMRRHRVFGDPARLKLGEKVDLNDALVNTTSGRVVLGDYSFCGHGVSLLTGTHDVRQREYARMAAVPQSGRDIVIGRGVWIASNATILGPCTVGDHAVVAAGSLASGELKGGWVHAGVPARPIRPVDDVETTT